MEAFLKSGKKIDLLFAHNDDMGWARSRRSRPPA